MKKEILKTFDLFIENADTEELKELIKDIKEMYEENETLHSIIKEAREYIETKEVDFVDQHYQQQDDYFNGLLGILEKENTCTNCGQENEQ